MSEQEKQKVYIVNYPYLSNGLKRSYNKQLHVYECELEPGQEFGVSERFMLETSVLWKYNMKSQTWESTNSGPKSKFMCYSNQKILKTLDLSVHHSRSGFAVYEDLEMAQAKIILSVHNLRKQYEAAIREIQSTCNRNVPDLTKDVEAVKQKYCEFFI